MKRYARAFTSILMATVALLTMAPWQPTGAEQFKRLGAYQGHYSLVPTLFLTPEVAAGYGITRARDRSLLNVSIIDPDSGPVRAEVTGSVRDLLGTERVLDLEEVVEGDAVYYMTTIRHADEEVLRFAIDVRTPDGARHEIAFQQKVYWERR